MGQHKDLRNKSEPGAEPARIVLVDDHPVIREGIRVALGDVPGMRIVGEADSIRDALKVIEAERPDVAVVDLRLRDGNGLELIKDVRARCPEVRVLVLSVQDELFYAERALAAGAIGYMSKDVDIRDLVDGIQRATQGEVVVSHDLASRVICRMAGMRSQGDGLLVERLTDRELQVFELIGHGVPTRDISRDLHISPKTVDSHREHIKEKLSLDSTPELLKYAIAWVHDQRPGAGH